MIKLVFTERTVFHVNRVYRANYGFFRIYVEDRSIVGGSGKYIVMYGSFLPETPSKYQYKLDKIFVFYITKFRGYKIESRLGGYMKVLCKRIK